MRVRIVDYKPPFVRLVLEDANPSYANAFRRALLSEVPVMAVDEVIFYANTTAFLDEEIAHRLAMVPIRTDLKTYSLGDGSVVTLKLDRTAEEDMEVVYAGDLEPSDPVIVPVRPKIPIVKMTKGDRLRFDALVRMGKGKWHAKWQAVSGLGYSYYPIYRLAPEAVKECSEHLKSCPKEAVEEEEGGFVVVKDYLSCPGLEECIERLRRERPELVKVVEWDDTRFIIKFETTGALTIPEILEAAVEELLKKFHRFEDELKAALESPGSGQR